MKSVFADAGVRITESNTHGYFVLLLFSGLGVGVG